MKKHFLILFILITFILNAREFVLLQELPYGTVGSYRQFGPLCYDFNRNGNDELIMWIYEADTSFLRYYEYQYDYHFDLIKTNKYKSYTWTAGIGDFDSDGLFEIMGGDPDSQFLYFMEQTDSIDLPDSITWHSDTIWESFYPLVVTNKIKPDSIDRVAGIGIPGLSDASFSYGFYYLDCIGDNTHTIDTFESSSITGHACFDVGDMNENGLPEIIYGLPDIVHLVRFEAIDTFADSFIVLDTIPSDNTENILIIEDTDGDLKQELLQAKVNYSGGGMASYGVDIYEDDNGDGRLDSIWATDFEVATSNDILAGCDIDYGDIDGDGDYEIVVCGGRHFEAWKSTANNTYTKVFEWTNSSYETLQSHIRCHDFNKNGIDEIIYSGSGTLISDEQTFIFECRPLAKLDYASPLDVGNIPLDSTIIDSVYLYAIDELPVVIDSMKMKNGYNISIIHPSYPCSIPPSDSIPIELQSYSDSNAFLSDSLIIYSNDWFGDVDYIAITGSFGTSGIEDNRHSELDSESDISIRNNTIYYSAKYPNSNITILDILGRPVYREEHSQSGEFDYNTSELMPGIYFVHLQDSENTITEKFIKLK